MTKTTFRPHVAERPGRCGMSSLVAQSRCPALPKTPGFQDLLVVQAPDLLLGLQDLKGVLLVYAPDSLSGSWWLELR